MTFQQTDVIILTFRLIFELTVQFLFLFVLPFCHVWHSVMSSKKKLFDLTEKWKVEEQRVTKAVLIGSDSEMPRDVFSLSNAWQLI